MKLIQKLTILAGAMFAFAGTAFGQLEVGTLTTPLPSTYSVAAASTNTTIASSNLVISVTRGANVAIQPIFKLQGAGTSAVVFLFDESLDGVNWSPVGSITASVTASTTTQVQDVANHSIGALPFLRLAEIRNPNATALTNLTIKYSIKTGL